MGIPIRFGIEFYGHLRQPTGRTLATRAFHIMYLPLIPLGTYELGLSTQPAPFSFKSLFAMYFKIYGLAAGAGLAVLALDKSWSYHPNGIWWLLASAAMFLAVFASWMFLGHAPLTRKSKRLYLVPVLALGTVGFLGFQALALWPDRQHGLETKRMGHLFHGEPPPADMKVSLETLQKLAGESSTRFTHVAADTRLHPGEMVELEVPGGFATGVIANVPAEGSEWIEVVMRANNRRYTVSRQVLTLIR